MDAIEQLINNVWVQRLFWSFIVIIATIFIYVVISRILSAKEKRNSKIFSSKKNRTYLRMLKNTLGYALLIIAVLLILQIFGVDTSSMLAGVGIIGLIIGFAIQDALKDIIKGFDIISDNYYNVGDVITFGDVTGKVLSVGLKTTKIQEIVSGDTISIANRNIDQVEIVAGNIFINIPLPYELPITKAESVLDEIIQNIKQNPNVTESSYLGLNDLASSSLNYLIKVSCDPVLKLQTRRDALGTIVKTLESHKISIPYNQLDLHTKK